MVITVLLLLIFIVLVWNYRTHYGRKGRLINLIPGPENIPIFGAAFFLVLPTDLLWKGLCNISDKYYPIGKVWAFFAPVVSIRHPDDLEIILNSTKHIEKSVIYNLLHPWFGTGLLTSGGDKWRSRRKILTPAFHFGILQQFINILINEGENMTQSLKDKDDTVVKDLIPFVGEHSLTAICETAMGVSLSNQSNFQRYRKAVHQMSEIVIYRILRPWWYNDFIFAFSQEGKKQAETLKILHGFTEKIIAERKLYHERTNGQYLKHLENDKEAEIEDVEVFGIRKKRLTLLDILIAAFREGHLTDLDIREEVDTFMFEGHDTVAMAITAALTLLAEHKDIQERVRIEINSMMQNNGKKLDMKSLQNLPYLDRCIKEALRLYPSVFFISRTISEDVKLKSYVIPGGTTLHLHIYGLHRDPNFWPNPDVFDPDRFLPEKIQNRHPYSYLPFSAGSRNCIGQRFAMLEMKAMMVPLIRNFYLEPIDYLKDLCIEPNLILRPNRPLRVRFVPIKNDLNKA